MEKPAKTQALAEYPKSVSPPTSGSQNLVAEAIDAGDVLAGGERVSTGDSNHQSIIVVLRLLREKQKFLSKVLVWALIVSTAVAFLIPKRYESSVRLMPPDAQSSTGMAMLSALTKGASDSFDLSGLAGDVLPFKSSGALFVGILQSRTVQDDLISKFDLRKVYWRRRWKDARKKLSARTAIAEDRKSGIITITVTDSDPSRANAMAQEYVAELNLVVNQLATSSARREREFLGTRLNEVTQDLERAEKDFSQFSSKNTAIDIKEQAKALVGAAATVQGQLIAAESELQGLKQAYGDENIRVRTLRVRIAELRSQLEKLGGKADLREGSSAGEDSVYPSIRKLPLLGVTYSDLYRRMVVQETIFRTLTSQYELAKVQEAKEIPTVRVLDPPDIPETKSFPPRLLIMFLGTCLAGSLGILWVLGQKMLSEMEADDPRKLFVVEAYGFLKEIVPKRSRKLGTYVQEQADPSN